MKRKDSHEIKIFWSDEDQEWIGVAPELPGCSASGESPEQAVKELKTAMKLWMESRRASKWPLPVSLSSRDLKGRILLRLPKALHRELLEKAAEEGVSLNQYLLYKLSAPVQSWVSERKSAYGRGKDR